MKNAVEDPSCENDWLQVREASWRTCAPVSRMCPAGARRTLGRRPRAGPGFHPSSRHRCASRHCDRGEFEPVTPAGAGPQGGGGCDPGRGKDRMMRRSPGNRPSGGRFSGRCRPGRGGVRLSSQQKTELFTSVAEYAWRESSLRVEVPRSPVMSSEYGYEVPVYSLGRRGILYGVVRPCPSPVASSPGAARLHALARRSQGPGVGCGDGRRPAHGLSPARARAADQVLRSRGLVRISVEPRTTKVLSAETDLCSSGTCGNVCGGMGRAGGPAFIGTVSGNGTPVWERVGIPSGRCQPRVFRPGLRRPDTSRRGRAAGGYEPGADGTLWRGWSLLQR